MTLNICMFKNIFSYVLRRKHVTLASTMLNNIVHLHTQRQNCHLNYQMSHATCNNVNRCTLKEVLMLTINIILAISGRGALKPLLGI